MTRRSAERPPPWATRLLDRVLPGGGSGQSARADLNAEFRERASRHPRRARWWFGWEAVKLAAHFARDGLLSPSRIREPVKRPEPMRALAENLRLALRRMRRAPGFTLVAILTMALGIGANVAIYSVIRTVILEPLPYRGPDRLVAIFEWNQPRDRRNNVANPGNFRAWRERAGSFSAMSAVSMQVPATVTFAGDPEEAMVQMAEPDFFQTLGVDAEVGRTFLTASGEPRPDEVVLSRSYWQQRFGGDPGVVGRTLEVNGRSVEVVGVLPALYVVFGEGTQLWVGTDLVRGDQTNSGRWLWAVGRLGPEVGFEAAREELEAIAQGLREEFPEFNGGWTVNPLPLKAQVVGDVSRGLWILMGAVGLLLLVACANVANLFLVQATHRQKEMAVRTSLGATGGRLVGLLLTESLLIALLGAVLGLGLAWIGTREIVAWMPTAFPLPRVEGVGIDLHVLAFALGLSALTGVVFGLAPAFQAVGAAPAATLNAEGRGPSRRTGLMRRGFIVAEVVLSVVLLSGAALLVRSMEALLSVDPGIDPASVLVGRVNLNGSANEENPLRASFFQEAVARISAQPGVVAAGGVTFLPMDGLGAATSYYPMDRPAPGPEDETAADIRNVLGDYFHAMGIGLIEGRVFDTRDGPEGPRTAIVNRTLAEKQWPGESAVGKPVHISWETEEPWEIVGVVEDVRLEGLEEEPREAIYLHFPRTPYFPWMQIAVRSTGDPASLAGTLRREIRALDPTLALGRVRVMEDIVTGSTARPRMTTFLMTLFAGLATCLAAVGLYGVLSFVVSQQEREIGLRLALGASSGGILRSVVGQGLGLVGIGLALGAAVSLFLGRVLESLLYGVEPHDPLALGAAGSLIAVVALLASFLPAWRASKVPPAEALRAE